MSALKRYAVKHYPTHFELVHPSKQSKKHGKYAQFLVIYCEGNFRETVGVWKRHSDFEELSRKVSLGHEHCKSFHPLAIEEDHDHDHEVLPNAVTSW